MVKWGMCIFILLSHLFAFYGVYLLAMAYSATMTLDFFIQQQVILMLGIGIGNHRLWTHRSFKAKLPVRILCMLCSSMCNEGSIYWWCRDHIMHHKYSDTDADPYNSNRGLLFSHMAWLFFDKHPALIEKSKEVDFSHLLSDPVVRFQYALDPYFRHFMCFGLPTLYGHYIYNDWKIGLFAFGFFRWIFTLQCTWTVNSLAHYTGTREYNKEIKPADNLLVSVLTLGEGWHNYHHAYPYDYSCADKNALIQYNPSKVLIDIMALSGMVYDRKVTKDKSSKITQSVMSDMLPLVGCHDSYKITINDHRALRIWLFETKDKIDGFNKISQDKLIDVTGNVDDFMKDLVVSSKTPIPFVTKMKNMFRLYHMDRIRLADKAG